MPHVLFVTCRCHLTAAATQKHRRQSRAMPFRGGRWSALVTAPCKVHAGHALFLICAHTACAQPSQLRIPPRMYQEGSGTQRTGWYRQPLRSPRTKWTDCPGTMTSRGRWLRVSLVPSKAPPSYEPLLSDPRARYQLWILSSWSVPRYSYCWPSLQQ